MILTFLTALFATAIRLCVFGNPDGVPIEACSTLTPLHGSSSLVCTVDCPFTLVLAEIDMSLSAVVATDGRYMCGSTHTSKMFVAAKLVRVQVNFYRITAVQLHGITGTEDFRGFMVQPRVSSALFDSSAAHVGTFLASADTQTLSCDGNSPVSAVKVVNKLSAVCLSCLFIIDLQYIYYCV